MGQTRPSSGERMISATATVNWESDGINVTVTAPPQSSTVELIGTEGGHTADLY